MYPYMYYVHLHGKTQFAINTYRAMVLLCTYRFRGKVCKMWLFVNWTTRPSYFMADTYTIDGSHTGQVHTMCTFNNDIDVLVEGSKCSSQQWEKLTNLLVHVSQLSTTDWLSTLLFQATWNEGSPSAAAYSNIIQLVPQLEIWSQRF